MKLKVQRTDTGVLVGGSMESLEEAKESGCEILVEDGLPSIQWPLTFSRSIHDSRKS